MPINEDLDHSRLACAQTHSHTHFRAKTYTFTCDPGYVSAKASNTLHSLRIFKARTYAYARPHARTLDAKTHEHTLDSSYVSVHVRNISTLDQIQPRYINATHEHAGTVADVFTLDPIDSANILMQHTKYHINMSFEPQRHMILDMAIANCCRKSLHSGYHTPHTRIEREGNRVKSCCHGAFLTRHGACCCVVHWIATAVQEGEDLRLLSRPRRLIPSCNKASP
jgi:hypothetical protein